MNDNIPSSPIHKRRKSKSRLKLINDTLLSDSKNYNNQRNIGNHNRYHSTDNITLKRKNSRSRLLTSQRIRHKSQINLNIKNIVPMEKN